MEVGFEVFGRWEGDEEDAEELPAFEDAFAVGHIGSAHITNRMKRGTYGFGFPVNCFMT